jgi:hydrogenase-1 operon protein HyaF
MTTPMGQRRPFPIPVVLETPQPGQPLPEEEGPAYLAMPEGMRTFTTPVWPKVPDPTLCRSVQATVLHFLADIGPQGLDTPSVLDLLPFSPPWRTLMDAVLGFGEVSALGHSAQGEWRVQETAFTGFWRVLIHSPDGVCLADRLETGPLPRIVYDTLCAAHATPSALPPFPDAPPEGCMNAPALLHEIAAQSRACDPNAPPETPAHVIDLTLLPLNEVDQRMLQTWLGTGPVCLLSRGYGNCRVTSTAVPHVWWVQYFNTLDVMILNSLEITPMPQAVLAAAEDFDEACLRLRESLSHLEEDL